MNKSKIVWFAIVAAVMAIIYYNNSPNRNTPAPIVKSTTKPAEKPEYDAELRLQRLASWGATDEAVALELDNRQLSKNYYLILDGSGSMNEVECSNGQKKIDAAREAVHAFSKNVPSGDNLGLLVFDNVGLRERLPLGQYDDSRVQNALKDVTAGGGTPLGKALGMGQDHLKQQAVRQRGYGEYNIVVITDGQASDEKLMVAEVEKILETTPITVHTVGFCISEDHSLNQPGRVIYRQANNPAELQRGLETVLAETEEFTDIEF